MTQAQKRILVLCTGNSARSQMAEALINARRGDRWHAESAGTAPAARVNPFAVKALAEIGIDHVGGKPQHIEDFLQQAFDVALTVCDHAAENCPVWPGQGKRVHMGYPDPAAAEGTDEEMLAVFRAVRDDIERDVLALLDKYDNEGIDG